MATPRWGNVYYDDVFAGTLSRDPGGRCTFTYDSTYLGAAQARPVSHTLPLRAQPFVQDGGLHPFFDNLTAEGWLLAAQARALGVSPDDKLALLIGFGRDLAGAVSVVDPDARSDGTLTSGDEVVEAALRSRASLSGVQRKLMVVRDGRRLRPAGLGEISTHIAKLASGRLGDVVELELLTTLATAELLPRDQVVEMTIGEVDGVGEPALIVRRFDRRVGRGGVRRLHFEEFNQLLGRRSGDDKYEGAYEEMGAFIRTTPGCLPVEADRLFRRILACLLTGNTDAHLKNFAMLHTRDGLRLTPGYDLIAAANYGYRTIALGVGGAKNLTLGNLMPKHVAALGAGFGLAEPAILSAVEDLGERMAAAIAAIRAADHGAARLKRDLIGLMEKRWQGSFASIGRLLSKRHGRGAGRRT
ncbi:MAG: HipA domain-containing protein [Alphaproteobacteria bacterium]|nr:HipA domain-containing protein [Alphaproteobacteria bacterium]MCW5744556.1 HipA domain-containing protein [Alphaproteobacteria bacterium]